MFFHLNILSFVRSCERSTNTHNTRGSRNMSRSRSLRRLQTRSNIQSSNGNKDLTITEKKCRHITTITWTRASSSLIPEIGSCMDFKWKETTKAVCNRCCSRILWWFTGTKDHSMILEDRSTITKKKLNTMTRTDSWKVRQSTRGGNRFQHFVAWIW